ncbi:MAG: DUF3098 domain-containing protein [Flavobacteriaceae bacterium]|nr:DUF3098 domain-containing protein [Flavobacteriaceae bacterium]MCY4267134.1 DUF3098 domain-containing protein [Flavobacteriaceae bacterium]MCY4299916.1 DUF3098 domain-containing protein [Flavobacteriaceae bacterium]
MGRQKNKYQLLFSKRNYQILGIALLLIVFGFSLMVGGGSEDPNVFNPKIFNFQRIRLAPTIVLCGFVLAVFSILAKSKTSK